MKRLGIVAVGLALVVVLSLAACSDEEDRETIPPTTATLEEEPPVVPPEGIRATVPADFPDVEEARLRQLALEPADLPPGFELQFEDASEEQDGTMYLAHYADVGALSWDDELVEATRPVAIDLMVILFNEESGATAFLSTLRSLSSDEIVRYTRTQRHWPDEELGLEQGEIEASTIPFRKFGDDSLAWQVSETVRLPENGTELTMVTVDVSVCIRRGRAVGMVDIGALNQPPETADVEALAGKLDERLATALR